MFDFRSLQLATVMRAEAWDVTADAAATDGTSCWAAIEVARLEA